MNTAPPDALTDADRLAAVHATGLFHAETEAAFDRLARVARRALDGTFALVSLVGRDRQIAKGRAGTDFDEAAVLGGICRHTVAAGAPLVLPDAEADDRVCDLAVVRGGVRAYLGVPLAMPGGAVVGSFMVADDAPRDWTPADVETMEDLAAAVVAEIGARVALRERAAEASDERDESRSLFRALLDGISVLTGLLDTDGAVVEANRAALSFAGVERADVVGRPLWASVALPEPVAERHRAAVARAASGETVRYEETLRDAGGREVVLEVALQRAPGAEGLLLLEGRDVTEAVRVRRAQSAMVAGQAGTFDYDLRAGAVATHGAVPHLFGLDPADDPYPVEAFFDQIHPDDVGRVRAVTEGSIEAGTAHVTEYRVVWPDGDVRWVRSHGDVVRGPDGAPARLVGALADVTQERQDAREAQDREATLRQALDAADLGAWAYTPADGLVRWDERCQALFGLPATSPLADGLGAIHPDDAPAVARAVEAAVAPDGDPNWDVEYRLPTADGPPRWVRSYGQATAADEGVRLAGVLQDVTAPKETERALRESEERYRTLFESIDVGFALLDLVYDDDGRAVDYRFVEMNPAFVGQSGLDDAEGRTIRELVPDIEGFWIETYGRVAETGRPVRVVDQAQALGRWFEVYADRVGGPGSGRVGVLFTDVTERRRAEDALRSSEARFRGTFENAAVGIAHVGVDGAWLRVNDRLSDIVGYTRDELLARTFQDVTHPDDLGTDLEQFERLLGGEIDRYQLEKRYLHRDGHTVWINLTVAPNRDASGAVEYVISIVEDVSDKKAAEAALRRLNDELEDRIEARTAELARSNAELDQFAYVASHDLKAPIRAIDSLATWIAEDAADALPPESARHLALLRQRAERMERLLDSLLAYSRAGRGEADPEPVDLRALVREATALVEPPEGFDVRVEGAFPTVETARAPLALVVRNLVSNAIKHHDRPDGRVTVSARTVRRDGRGWAEVTVSDDGPGIAPEYQNRVFGLFQTLRPRDEVEGSGMGLAIVKKAVESRGGAISVTSEGRGAMFRFTWPLAPGAATQSP